jgi:hypothetical protein
MLRDLIPKWVDLSHSAEAQLVCWRAGSFQMNEAYAGEALEEP